MLRTFAAALLACALYLPASAEPLAITPDNVASGQVPAPAQGGDAAALRPVAAGGQVYAQADQSNYGGGFLEFLFGGAARQPAVSRPYQPAPAEYQGGYQPPPGAQPTSYGGDDPQYAPSSQGDMAHQPIDPKFERQTVEYHGHEEAGTIVVDTPDKFLYLVEGNGKALRYGIGVGRPGFTWAGDKTITAKREWPDWRPPDEMIKRRPDLPRYMAGGPDNPLGARAMYLGSTLYRIHGSNEPWTIGTRVSSGCIRMRNEDVIDLYNRVNVGTKVVVI